MLWVALPCVAMAQDLAPEVLQLAQIKSHLREEITRLPNYTCLETISRFHREAARGSKFLPLDAVRLEIVYSNGREWYGSPGDRNLSEENPVSFIGAGMIGNGIFAITLHNLFVANVAMFTSHGEDSVDGHAELKYGFSLRRMLHGLQISVPGGSGTVGEEGFFWVDGRSLDLLRLDVRAAEIPEFLPLVSAEFKVTYARTRIAEFDTLLAQQADMHMQLTDGSEDYDRFEFTHCRAFHTDSVLQFDSMPFDPGRASPEAPRALVIPSKPETLPALLPVTVELTTPITSNDYVGKVIEGRIVGDVQRKGKVVIEDGARVRGRIRRLDRYAGGESFVVGLEFTEVRARGVPMRFYADLLKIEKRKGIRTVLREPVRLANRPEVTDEIVLPELPGVASFFIEGKTFILPSSFRTVWRTRGLLRGAS